MNKIIAVFFALILCASCNSSTSHEVNKNPVRTDIKVIFDVPTLIGKNMDQVRKLLGKPSDKEIEPSKLQKKNNFDTWDNSFEKDGKTLLVTYNPQNRKVTDFFISSTDPSGASDNYAELLSICNVNRDNAKYSIEPVPAIKDQTKYTGIKIIPN